MHDRPVDGRIVQAPRSLQRLASYRVRDHTAGYRHITLAMLAHAYLSATHATAGRGYGPGNKQLIALTVPELRRPAEHLGRHQDPISIHRRLVLVAPTLPGPSLRRPIPYPQTITATGAAGAPEPMDAARPRLRCRDAAVTEL